MEKMEKEGFIAFLAIACMQKGRHHVNVAPCYTPLPRRSGRLPALLRSAVLRAGSILPGSNDIIDIHAIALKALNPKNSRVHLRIIRMNLFFQIVLMRESQQWSASSLRWGAIRYAGNSGCPPSRQGQGGQTYPAEQQTRPQSGRRPQSEQS